MMDYMELVRLYKPIHRKKTKSCCRCGAPRHYTLVIGYKTWCLRCWEKVGK